MLSRDPELEPPLQSVELGPFGIDRLPYPNDPAANPTRTSSRAEAAALCAQQQGRLCTELEWERACKGPDSQPFSSGEHWVVQCESSPYQCVNGFGVAGLGAFAEWTASDAEQSGTGQRLAVARAADAGDASRRCAHRSLRAQERSQEPLVFRCCYGPPNAAAITPSPARPAFERATLNQAELSRLLAQHPRTRPFATEARFFKEPDAAETVVARGVSERQGFSFTVAPLYWSPVPGTRFLALTGSSGKDHAFVLLYHALADQQHRLASSFIMKREPGPVAFAYSNDIHPRFHFSTCWGCPGETGKIVYRDPDQAVILQP